MTRRLLISALLGFCISASAATPAEESPWIRQSKWTSHIAPRQVDLSRAHTLTVKVPNLPNRWLVPNLYLPTTEPYSSDTEIEKVPGHDASISLTIIDTSGERLSVVLDPLNSQGWGGAYGTPEIRWHRPLNIGPSSSPLVVELTVNLPSTEPAIARFVLSSTDNVISELTPNKALQLTGHSAFQSIRGTIRH
jgi:hypothetical protein